MNRRTSWILALLVGGSALLMQSGAASASSGPVISRYTDSGTFVDRELCGYPIRVTWHEHGRVYRWFDANGDLDHLVVHKVFSEVALANGKVATGIDRQKLVSDQQGTYVFTGTWIFFLPDGSHIQNAGWAQTTYGGQVLSEHGPHPLPERLAELFCPAMS
jgi:hypothetical protein